MPSNCAGLATPCSTWRLIPLRSGRRYATSAWSGSAVAATAMSSMWPNAPAGAADSGADVELTDSKQIASAESFDLDKFLGSYGLGMRQSGAGGPFVALAGEPPSPARPPPGCAFPFGVNVGVNDGCACCRGGSWA